MDGEEIREAWEIIEAALRRELRMFSDLKDRPDALAALKRLQDEFWLLLAEEDL